MNGLHDLGGMHGFGPVRRASGESPFGSEAEKRMFGLMLELLTKGYCDPDGFRAEVEALPPRQLLREVFHENWLMAVEAQLVERGVLEPGELDRAVQPQEQEQGKEQGRPPDGTTAPSPPSPALSPPAPPPPPDPGVARPPRFRVGDRVRARNLHPMGHTRLPRYSRGHVGVIERDHGVFGFSDSLAARTGRQPQHLYGVRFSLHELWGDERADTLVLDLFDSYLEPTA